MCAHPKNTSLGEVRLAGGSHARDRRESQWRKLLRSEWKQLVLNKSGNWLAVRTACFVVCGTNSYFTRSAFASGGSPAPRYSGAGQFILHGNAS